MITETMMIMTIIVVTQNTIATMMIDIMIIMDIAHIVHAKQAIHASSNNDVFWEKDKNLNYTDTPLYDQMKHAHLS